MKQSTLSKGISGGLLFGFVSLLYFPINHAQIKSNLEPDAIACTYHSNSRFFFESLAICKNKDFDGNGLYESYIVSKNSDGNLMYQSLKITSKGTLELDSTPIQR